MSVPVETLDTIEFVEDGNVIARTPSSMRIEKGDVINIKRKDYKVTRVYFAVDHAMRSNGNSLRCVAVVKALEKASKP